MVYIHNWVLLKSEMILDVIIVLQDLYHANAAENGMQRRCSLGARKIRKKMQKKVHANTRTIRKSGNWMLLKDEVKNTFCTRKSCHIQTFRAYLVHGET